ncbi:hypothetical protein [Thalassobacillus pellis]|nr:hypothetical protein [Thalassobacillus pellis]MBM7554168.1 hypothetical protein [Thalassobacillus pellis]
MKKGLLKLMLLLFVSSSAIYSMQGLDDVQKLGAADQPNYSDEDHPEY